MAGIECSNPAEGMDFRLCLNCVGSGLCDELITCSEECYQVCVCVCLIICVIYKSETKRRSPDSGWCVTNRERTYLRMKGGSE